MLYIIGKDRRYIEHWANDHSLIKKEYRVITNADELRGLGQGHSFLFLPDWMLMKNAEEIEAYIDIIRTRNV